MGTRPLAAGGSEKYFCAPESDVGADRCGLAVWIFVDTYVAGRDTAKPQAARGLVSWNSLDRTRHLLDLFYTSARTIFCNGNTSSSVNIGCGSLAWVRGDNSRTNRFTDHR